MKSFKSFLTAGAMACVLSLPQVSAAQQPVGVQEDPSALAMTGDVLVARPLLIGATVVGAAVWLVGSPFSLMAGNVEQSAETLIGGPAKAAFNRCLGCIGEGYELKGFDQFDN